MATIKQQRAVQKILENPRLPVGRAMIESGYSTNTAVHPSDLMRSKGFKELLDCYLPDDLLTSKLARNVKNKNGFISNHAIDIAFKILKFGSDVIIDEGFWVKSQRDDIKKKILQVGAKPIFYYVESSVEKMKERVTNRSKNPTKDSFEISEEMFNSYLKYWQAPDESEDVIVIRSSEL